MCMCMRACLCARNLTLSVMKKKKILKGACVCVRACVRVGVFAHFKHVVLEHVGSPAFGCR